MTRPPILVTGSHRSGTTWTGEMLCASGEAGYVHEPLNPRRRPGWTGNRIPYWFLYVTPENEAYYKPVIDDVLAFRYPLRLAVSDVRSPKHAATIATDWPRSVVYRMRRLRPLMKDPIALFSAEWLVEKFGSEVVVMIRHPAAFVGSIKRLNWQFRFRSWLQQDALMRDWLEPFRDDMRRLSAGDGDVVDQGIVMWNALHHVIDSYRARHPQWSFIKYEDLAADPLGGFRTLYEHLGLKWSERVERRIQGHSAADNPGEVASWRHQSTKRDSRAAANTWRHRLTQEEIDRIRRGTADMSERFYTSDEWG